jgi:hypothetical protein
VKLQHLKKYLNNAKHRAIRENVPFSLVLQDLIDIATDECPILHTPFVWGASGLGKGKMRPDSPTLDRIMPELGYVKGNVAFLSYRANRIKDNGTMQEHYDIADWIWNHTHAKKKSTTPVSAEPDLNGQADAKRRALLAARLREDRDNPDHYCGTDDGQDPDHRAQASSGDGMGRGSAEVGTSKTLESFKNYWESRKTIGWP